MRTTARVVRDLVAAPLGTTLPAGVSAAPAPAAPEASPQAEAVDALPAPTPKRATIKVDNIVLMWNRMADERDAGYLVYANGKLLPPGWRTSASADRALLYPAPLGLTGREVFTVAAGSDSGSDGTPTNTLPRRSNSLVPTVR